ncbi:PqqD family protein [Novosphingobium ginsenosidimutans]|uniref:PqqD family protein n=2 Tax=Novosphingobium ginsenosidimutans TaxID=1176536 RepID=A0A5B8SBN2_9SPHN|nr:PqqD family protein [Novosphingobium ginsenosidimutans]
MDRQWLWLFPRARRRDRDRAARRGGSGRGSAVAERQRLCRGRLSQGLPAAACLGRGSRWPGDCLHRADRGGQIDLGGGAGAAGLSAVLRRFPAGRSAQHRGPDRHAGAQATQAAARCAGTCWRGRRSAGGSGNGQVLCPARRGRSGPAAAAGRPGISGNRPGRPLARSARRGTICPAGRRSLYAGTLPRGSPARPGRTVRAAGAAGGAGDDGAAGAADLGGRVRRVAGSGGTADQGVGTMTLAKAAGQFTEATIDEEVVVMSLASGDFFSLTGTARSIWLALDAQNDRAGLIAALAAEYGVEPSAIAQDVDPFLAQLAAAGLLTGA